MNADAPIPPYLKAKFKRAFLDATTVALVAEFIGEITGTRPPSERSAFPPEWEPALQRLCDGLVQAVKEFTDG